MEETLKKFIEELNQRKTIPVVTIKTLHHNFVRAGQRMPRKPLSQVREGILTKANDWVLCVDYEHKPINFPQHIFSTSLRPDIVIWSRMRRHVVLVELTCCAEEGTEAAQLRKEVRYHELVENINENNWNAELFTVEVGARGLIGNRTFRVFVKLGLPPQTAAALCKTLSVIVARCSYAICLAQNNKEWSHNTDLILAEPSRKTHIDPPHHSLEESKETQKEDKEEKSTRRQRKDKKCYKP
jgi:hypothetical protein